jgi:hypothetical protein
MAKVVGVATTAVVGVVVGDVEVERMGPGFISTHSRQFCSIAENHLADGRASAEG